jgi:hypothetical protein
LNINRLLVLRDHAEISASAADLGHGGNVSITGSDGLILAVPKEDSDITARAFGGQGGQVNINAKNVLGFSVQQGNFLSNIDATSAAGPQGVVTITNVGDDPNQGLQPDPIAPSTPNLSQVCPGNRDRLTSKFIDSGRGGVVAGISTPLRSNGLWSDLRSRPQSATMPSSVPTIVAAQGWVAGGDRTVVLTSQPANYANSVEQAHAQDCHGR